MYCLLLLLFAIVESIFLLDLAGVNLTALMRQPSTSYMDNILVRRVLKCFTTVSHLLPPFYHLLDTRTHPLYHFPLFFPFNGLAIFLGPLYSGQSSFVALPTKFTGNPTTSVPAQSLTLSSAVWSAMNSSNNNPFVIRVNSER